MIRLLSTAILLVVALLSSAQTTRNQTTNVDTAQQYTPPTVKQFQPPVFRGVSLHADAASPLMGLAYGNVINIELQADVNLYRRVYPIFEAGFSSVRHTASSGATYSTTAPFFRLGINYGLLKPFKDDGSSRSVKSYPFAGVRYAFAPMNYNIDGLTITDPYWGTQQPISFADKLVYTGWVEAVAGVRIDLLRGLTMGWSVRIKTFIHTSAPDKSYLWYVPGYGNSSGLAFGFNYTIGYTFYSEK